MVAAGLMTKVGSCKVLFSCGAHAHSFHQGSLWSSLGIAHLSSVLSRALGGMVLFTHRSDFALELIHSVTAPGNPT